MKRTLKQADTLSSLMETVSCFLGTHTDDKIRNVFLIKNLKGFGVSPNIFGMDTLL